MLRRLLTPSMVDVFFAVLLAVAFARAGGWQQLLADGDTGWHIRTGELILSSGHVPAADPFSFSKPAGEWYAWEWLSDVSFAAAFRLGGMAAVVTLSAAVLCLSAAILLAWMLRRGAGLWIALALTLAAVSASTCHYLARPHAFSILLYAATLWILDEVRRGKPALLWILPPLCVLWCNLHGAFLVLPFTLLLAAGFETAQRRRYLLAALACAGASLANPYGWKLHQHIAAYLGSSWVMQQVQEFQSPDIRSEGMIVFALLLLAGVAMAAREMAPGRRFEAAVVMVWAFAALRSARHIPFFSLSAAPVIASGIARWWRAGAQSAPAAAPRRILWEVSQDFGRRFTASLWLPLLSAAVIAAAPPRALDFPDTRFPVRAVDRHTDLLASAPATRILTSDQWGDYLIYRFYPRVRVFFDGRSDFYGPELVRDYRALLAGGSRWPQLMARYDFNLALLPRAWPLSTALASERGWSRIYEDPVAVLYQRTERSTP